MLLLSSHKPLLTLKLFVLISFALNENDNILYFLGVRIKGQNISTVA